MLIYIYREIIVNPEIQKDDFKKDDLKRDKSFDYNLLTTFHAIYSQKSVTKASVLLNISPSAVSQSLNKLRGYFSDPLFVREGSNLSATVTAVNLFSATQENFEALTRNVSVYMNSTARNRLIISCPAYISMRVLPVLMALVKEMMPNTKVIHANNGSSVVVASEALRYRKADLVFDFDPHYSSSSITYPILKEELTFICRKNHPRLNDSINKEQAALEQFSIFESDGPAIKLIQQSINDNIGERVFSFRSSTLFSILSIVENSDTVAIIPTWLFNKVENSFTIKTLSTDFPLLPINIYMVHNKTALQNKALGNIVEKLNNHFNA